MQCISSLLLAVAVLFILPAGIECSSSRNVNSLTTWAQEQGICMHKSLQWKQYDEKDNNWGLELKEPVPPGTTLMQVPKSLVLDADCLQEEFLLSDGDEALERALHQLGDFDIHKDGFFIFLKVLRCSKERDSKWTPWIQGMPQTFIEFSEAEKQCLPFYAKYAADYQDEKFKAFCRAAAELGEWNENDDPADSLEKLKWAFRAVASRSWKTVPQQENENPNTEMVPVGDMFNHCEPPNVAVTHDGDSVNFVYKGTANENSKDLYLSYGQPSNPHRFLAIFGFVPTDMPFVWSHIAYPDNPFSANVSEMVVRASDGNIPKIVWDAVLYALLQPPQGTPIPEYTKEQHAKYRKFTLNVLETHVAKQLEELAALRQKIETTQGENVDLIRQHNEFLTNVFSKVQAHLEAGDYSS